MKKCIGVVAWLILIFSAFSSIRAADTQESTAGLTLTAGTYVAQLQGAVSHTCFEKAREALQSIEGITYVSVDPKQSQVRFVVKHDATLRVPEIQWTLRAAGVRAGQGAYYRLHNIVQVAKD